MCMRMVDLCRLVMIMGMIMVIRLVCQFIDSGMKFEVGSQFSLIVNRMMNSMFSQKCGIDMLNSVIRVLMVLVQLCGWVVDRMLVGIVMMIVIRKLLMVSLMVIGRCCYKVLVIGVLLMKEWLRLLCSIVYSQCLYCISSGLFSFSFRCRVVVVFGVVFMLRMVVIGFFGSIVSRENIIMFISSRVGIDSSRCWVSLGSLIVVVMRFIWIQLQCGLCYWVCIGSF